MLVPPSSGFISIFYTYKFIYLFIPIKELLLLSSLLFFQGELPVLGLVLHQGMWSNLVVRRLCHTGLVVTVTIHHRTHRRIGVSSGSAAR